MDLVNKISYPPGLPVSARAEDIIAALERHRVVVIAGETGSGKTTQLPKMCLAAGLEKGKMIACTQPRRIAATSVSRRVAEELGELAPLVGYKIRFSDRTTPATKIKFLTDGMLLAEAGRDRHLRRYQYIIIDEAHERSLNIDFLLGILRRLLDRRRDLKVIISSATLDTEKFARHFPDSAVIEVEGKTFPVEVRYRPPDEDADEGLPEQVAAAVEEILDESPHGDILAFLPTERDIMDTVELLRGIHDDKEHLILPLFGRLSGRDQGRIFAPDRRRKIVVATNVAETSITVPGIRSVIDSGLARISTYNPRARTTKLPVTRISRASAEQRKGRCGRIGPGICLRLYSEEDFESRPAFTPPEIQRANLADVILRMVDLRLGDPVSFPFIDPPHPRAVRDGFALLEELGAIRRQRTKKGRAPARGRQLTRRGRLMARLPIDPCIARMIIEAGERRVMHEVMIIAAGLGIQDPRLRPPGQEKEADARHRELADPRSDFLTMLAIFDRYRAVAKKVSRSRLRAFCRQNFLAPQRMREWHDLYRQLERIMAAAGELPPRAPEVDAEAVHQAILSGILRHIAMKKEGHLFTGAHGKEVMVFPGSVCFKRPGKWIMAAELMETTRLYARTVAPIDPAWLERLAGPLCKKRYSDPHWQKKKGQVAAYETVTLFGLVIVGRRLVNYAPIDPLEARRIFLEHAMVRGEVPRPLAFLNKNRALIARLSAFEERSRRRNIVDESRIYAFYEQRLPPEVVDMASLRRVLPKVEASLVMCEEEITVREPDHGALSEFPTRMRAGGVTVRLRYRFDPGSDEDGVSVQIPAAAVSGIDPSVFDWLVPGLLADKLTALFKALPKSQRRPLVPVNATVEEVQKNLEFGKGDFFQAVAAAVRRCRGARIDPVVLRRLELPPHLTMRFCLVDDRGRVLSAGRDFTSLLAGSRDDKAAPAALGTLRRTWARPAVTLEEVCALPETIAIPGRRGTHQGTAFPVLVMTDKGVGLDLCLDPEEAKEKNRQGLLALYRQALAPQVRQVSRDCVLGKADWPLFHWLGSGDEVKAALMDFLLSEILAVREGRLPHGREPETLLADLGKRLYPEAQKLFQAIRKVLELRQRTVEMMRRFAQKGKGGLGQVGFDEHLEQILPPDFLHTFTAAELTDVSRHLRALGLRVERAYASPAADAAKARRLAPQLQRLDSLAGREQEISVPARRRQFIDARRHFASMINEFRISLFAPEIKTAFPVSEKRLDAAWQAICDLL